MNHRTEHEAVLSGLQSHRILLPTGITMHYVEKDASPSARHGTGIDRAVVLLHGFPDSWRSFEEMLGQLPMDATSVFALDLRGHGATSDLAIHAYTMSDLAADVAGFLDMLRIERAVLVGHSFGGFLAHQVAVEYPKKVAGLVIISSAATMAGHLQLAELRKAAETFDDDAPAPIALITEFQASTFFQPPPPHVLNRYVQESMRVKGIVWRTILADLDREDHRALLPLIDAPALVLWGEEDTLFSRAEQDDLMRLLANARLITFPGAGHALNVERAESVVEALRAFINETAVTIAA